MVEWTPDAWVTVVLARVFPDLNSISVAGASGAVLNNCLIEGGGVRREEGARAGPGEVCVALCLAFF